MTKRKMFIDYEPDFDEAVIQMLIGTLCDKERALSFMWIFAGAAAAINDDKKFASEGVDDLVRELIENWDAGIDYLEKHPNLWPKGMPFTEAVSNEEVGTP